MDIILQTIIPLIIIGFFGYLSVEVGIFNADATKNFNKFLFNIAIPILLFRLTANIGVNIDGTWVYLLTHYGIILVVFFIHQIIAHFIFKRTNVGVPIFAFAAIFGNSLNIGLAAIILLLGEEQAYPFILIISLHGLVLLTVCHFIIALYDKEYTKQISPLKLPFSIFIHTLKSNPIIFAALAGMVWNMLGIPWYNIIENTTQPLAAAVMPIALFSIGMNMSGYSINGQVLQASYIVISKLILLPLLVYFIFSYYLNAPDIWVFCATFAAALPSGNMAHIVAQHYNNGTRMATSSIFLTTIFSIPTLSIIIYYLYPYA